MGTNNNVSGVNQYKDRREFGSHFVDFLPWLNPFLVAPMDDEFTNNLIRDYHRKGNTSRTVVSKLLLKEHGITQRYGLYYFWASSSPWLAVQHRLLAASANLVSHVAGSQQNLCQRPLSVSW